MNGLDLSKTRFILPADAELLPVCDLSPSLRAKLGAVDETAVVITRPGFRATTRLVPAPMAALLEEFRVESLVTEAVMRFSRAQEQDPLEILDMVFDGISTLIGGRILLAGTEADAQTLVPSLRSGQTFCGIRIERLVRSLNDSEVFYGRTETGAAVALKLARDGRAGEALRKEAGFLALLDGQSSPRLLKQGQSKGREWLALEWRSGVPISVASQTARASGDKSRLFRLVAGLLDAYAALHARGIAHGDIHPGNLIADARDQITILDFGQATLSADSPAIDLTRTGIPYFYDPQMAQAILHESFPPGATALGEQFALGTLAYLLIAGVYPMHGAAESTKILKSIVKDRPLPFAAQGVDSWPRIEAVLRRGLAKDPADRYPDTAAFSRAFRTAGASPRNAPASVPADTFEILRTGVVLDGCVPHVMAWLCLRAAIVGADADLAALASISCARAAPGWEAAFVAAQVAGARSDWCDQAEAVATLTAELRDRRTWNPRMLMHIAHLVRGRATDRPIDADTMLTFTKASLGSPAARTEGDESVLHAKLELQRSSVLAQSSDTREQLDRLRGGSIWLWSLAYDIYQDETYLDRALAAEVPQNPIHHGFACLRLHQLTGDMHWVKAALRDANTASLSPESILLSIECGAPSRAEAPLLTGLPDLFALNDRLKFF
ncbi:phosphotransferase [Roseovarius sp. M141]|uniref:protein kinase domain-containing protein n=1 Tax=Roseovarius sp. M141 TaxID=2583806 RepID=UPI0020CC38D5|nr:phosphotransferase [Roseovarius sp. M141]MCQ0094195.1 hypothetical protein [Roseovarius sp. M141]